MSAATIIYQILSNDSNITALVGSGNDCRITPLAEYKSYTLPFITFQEISTIPNATKTGPSTMDESVYQIDIVADTRYNANTLSELVRNALDYNRGTFYGVVLSQCTFEQQRDQFEEFTANDGAVMIQQDYRLFIAR